MKMIREEDPRPGEEAGQNLCPLAAEHIFENPVVLLAVRRSIDVHVPVCGAGNLPDGSGVCASRPAGDPCGRAVRKVHGIDQRVTDLEIDLTSFDVDVTHPIEADPLIVSPLQCPVQGTVRGTFERTPAECKPES